LPGLTLLALCTSCKRDFVCQCVYTDNGVVEATIPTDIHDTRSNAKASCAKGNAQDGVLKKTCSLQ